MKAFEAKPGDLIEFQCGSELMQQTVCLVKERFCWLNNGIALFDNEVKLIFEGQSFYVTEYAFSVLAQFVSTDFSLIHVGRNMLFVSRVRTIQDSEFAFKAWIFPTFYDSRLNCFWTMDGKEFSPINYLCIDLEYTYPKFHLFSDGVIAIEKYYPSDI